MSFTYCNKHKIRLSILCLDQETVLFYKSKPNTIIVCIKHNVFIILESMSEHQLFYFVLNLKNKHKCSIGCFT